MNALPRAVDWLHPERAPAFIDQLSVKLAVTAPYKIGDLWICDLEAEVAAFHNGYDIEVEEIWISGLNGRKEEKVSIPVRYDPGSSCPEMFLADAVLKACQGAEFDGRFYEAMEKALAD